MKRYIRFTIYANIPSLLLITPIAIHIIFTRGNLPGIMAMYNLTRYSIPVTIILIYLIRSLKNELKPQKAYMVLYFVLSTIAMALLFYAWGTRTPLVILISFILSNIGVFIYKQRNYFNE